MSETYTRRPVPSAYNQGYFSTELATIQRVLASLASSSFSLSAAAPIHYDAGTTTVSHDASGVAAGTKGDATHSARVTVDADGHVTGLTEVAITGLTGTTVQAARLTSDVSTNGGAFVTSALTLPVLTGESWTFRWVLALGTSVGASGGISFRITAPSNTGHFGVENGVRTSAPFNQTSVADPLLFATTIANEDFSASISWAVIDASFYNFTADGTVDLQFKNNGSGETAILRQASAFTAVKTG